MHSDIENTLKKKKDDGFNKCQAWHLVPVTALPSCQAQELNFNTQVD